MNKSLILKRVLKLHDLFHNGKIPTLSQHEVSPGLNKSSRENYLYFTLPPCINFQRNSPAMWASALATYQDPETNYLFFPEVVVKRNRSEIQTHLKKHKLALQQNKHTDIWIAISTTLNKYFSSNPFVLLESGGFDVTKILQILQKDQKKDFPYLSGYKMANYWLYILSQYTDVSLKNMSDISIIPDTHVLQSTVKLGLAEKLVSPQAAEILWKELLSGSELSPVQMHPVLWNWSRNNFFPNV